MQEPYVLNCEHKGHLIFKPDGTVVCGWCGEVFVNLKEYRAEILDKGETMTEQNDTKVEWISLAAAYKTLVDSLMHTTNADAKHPNNRYGHWQHTLDTQYRDLVHRTQKEECGPNFGG